MADYRDHHATISVPPEIAGPIEALRREWDPSMAASGKIPSFRLGLGGIGCFERPEDGVYVDVEDVDGGYARLREEVLRADSRSHQRPERALHGRGFDGVAWVVLETFSLA